MTANPLHFSCVSWNIHRGRGNDGVVDPDRTRRVLAQDICVHKPDALILQEADEEVAPHRGFLDIAGIEADSGLCHIHTGSKHRWGTESHGFLGVMIFLQPAWQIEDIVLLDLPGHCHRGAVVVDLLKDGQPLRLIGTHLSLSQVLRMVQMRIIGQHLFRRSWRPAILCGDLNEWRPWGGLALSRWLIGTRLSGPALATFPIERPFLALDRILVTDPARVVSAQVLNTAAIRATSDHRPLMAKIDLGAKRPGPAA